jgi:hypothetical protein
MKINVENIEGTMTLLQTAIDKTNKLVDLMKDEYTSAYEQSKINYDNMSWWRKIWDDGFDAHRTASVCLSMVTETLRDLITMHVCIDKINKFTLGINNSAILSDEEVEALHRCLGDRTVLVDEFNKHIKTLRGYFL